MTSPAERLRANRERIAHFNETRDINDVRMVTDVLPFAEHLGHHAKRHTPGAFALDPLGSPKTWRRHGEYREVPMGEVYAGQRGVVASRAAEIMASPRAGRDLRFPASMSSRQHPLAEEIRDVHDQGAKRVVVNNGNHRFFARAMSPQGELFQPLHVLPAEHRREAKEEGLTEMVHTNLEPRAAKAMIGGARAEQHNPFVGSAWRERGQKRPSRTTSLRHDVADGMAKAIQETLF